MLVVALLLASSDPRLAVLPFKNLNQDTSLDWLKLGVAETMISDLKNAHKAVVEREQIDKALAELALQSSAGTEDGTAAEAGKLVGATHVVVGGFQRAADQVRITARLVAVETGVVNGSAKVTGPLTNIFSLQDAITAQLLHLDPPKRAKPKNAAKTLDAYKAYSLALSTSSDAEKVEQLKKALDLDPDFHYALADLRVLEARLDRYAKKGRAVMDERTAKMLAVVDDPKATPQDRNMNAVMAMNSLMQQFRYQALLDVATRIEGTDLPEVPPVASGMQAMKPKEYASFYVWQSLSMLKKQDLAMQAGERYLQQYPAGMFAQSVDLQMRAAIDAAHRHEQNVKNADKELASIELDERDLEQKNKLSEVRRRSFAFRKCSTLGQGERWTEAIVACKQFGDDYQDANDDDNLVKLSHFLTMRAFTELGRFDEARAEANRLLDAFPEWSRTYSLDMQMKTWPQP